jgi:hypothetical protein
MDEYPNIIVNHIDPDVDAVRIIQRILRFAPKDVLRDLTEIVLLDKNHDENCFACYRGDKKRIELYLGDIIGWLPWILKRSYVIPYLFIGQALGHELDHHVNRHNKQIDREASAETNAIKYIYPSFGLFKPLVRLASYVLSQSTLANKSLEKSTR